MAHAKNEQKREMLLSFQVITDTHVTSNPKHAYNLNLERALQDIAVHAPGTNGIMHVGDATNHGFSKEYKEWRRIWSRHKDSLPEPICATGNHDVGMGIWRFRLAYFLAATGMPGAYHDHWIEGYHFIFLGTEKSLKLHCSLSEKQLAWLDAKLSEQASPDRPIFLFLHQPLLNTVAGSHEAQGWNGVKEDAELKAVLSRHPQTMMFTGHTHWELESANTCFIGGGDLPELPVMFNAASVAYLWNDAGDHKQGSQGYYVEVYRDRVLVRGRDFTRGEWVEGARFEIEYRPMPMELRRNG